MSDRKEERGGPSMSSIHSANQWESAKFDDDAKRQKFLRLMGGMKKEHTGRFVIGDTHQDAHTRSADENKQLTETLEHQYQVGLEKKLTGQNRRHVGLGFSEPEEEQQPQSKPQSQPQGTHIRFESSDEEDGSEDGEGAPGAGREERDGDREASEDSHGEGKARKKTEKGEKEGARGQGGDSGRIVGEEKKPRSRDEPDESDERRRKKHKTSKREGCDSGSD